MSENPEKASSIDRVFTDTVLAVADFVRDVFRATKSDVSSSPPSKPTFKEVPVEYPQIADVDETDEIMQDANSSVSGDCM
jgi:hypothetical protein